MKNHLKRIFFFGCAILFFSCEDIPQDNIPDSNPLRFETLTFEKTGGACQEAGKNCISIKLEYPNAIDGNAAVRDSINAFIKEALLENLTPGPEINNYSIESAADSMIAFYIAELEETPEYDLAWDVFVEGEAEVVDSFAVVSIASSSYLGGAHPNYYISFLNYNLHTQKEVFIEELITDKTAFMKLGEQKFLEARISEYEQQDARMEDFFFGEGYHLPENFAIKKEGIFLYYNPYEAAPYVLGPTEYLIPYSDLKGMISLIN